MYLKWFAWAAGVFIAFELLQLPLRKKNIKAIFALMFVIKFMAAIVVAYCSMAFSNRFVWNLGYLPAALYGVLLSGAITDLVALVLLLFRKKDLKVSAVMAVSLIITAAFMIYGTVNMQTIVPKEHSYTSDKLKGEYKIVFLADLHYGSAQSPKTVEKALNDIREIKPDLILLGGDITDEHTTAEEMRQIYNQLGKLGAPTFFFYGNHDRQNHGDYLGGAKYTPDELVKAIEGNGIKILKDELQMWGDDLAILGRENDEEGPDRAEVSRLPKLPPDRYVICVDHSPYLEDDIKATGADLQLSGHTHAGQFFPLRYVYRLGVNNIYGDYKLGGTDLYVSSGITGWYFPFRTEAHCNYEVITLSKTP